MSCLRLTAVSLSLTLCASGFLAAEAAPGFEPVVGPRGLVGPDAPLSDAEQRAFARRVPAEGRTAAAVQAACAQAVAKTVGAVFLPAGEYTFEVEVAVPAGITVLGEGAKTVVRAKDSQSHLFRADGDRARFTRMRLLGASATRSTENETYGITVDGKRDVRIDHCELLGFSYATDFAAEATAQVDHCAIHHNLRDGLGYGVAIYSGAYVLVTDNDFSQNRHSLASNGALDWSSPERLGHYVHKPGVRKTHWAFVHNHVGSNDLTEYEMVTVDTHPGMDGTFLVEANVFEGLRHAVGIRDGAGVIRGNLLRDFRTITAFRQLVGISVAYGTHNNVAVEGCMPHDIEVAENTFLDAGNPKFEKYQVGRAENITIDGALLPTTRTESRVQPPPMPWLAPMGDDGRLTWQEAGYVAPGTGSVAGTVSDADGHPVAGAELLVGERLAATDAEGRFAFPAVSEAAAFVAVRRPGFELELVGLRVEAGRQATLNVRLRLDRTKSVLSAVRLVALSHHSATVAWETSEPTGGEVTWSSAAGGQAVTAVEAPVDKPRTAHTLELPDLQPAATYRLRVKATDLAGNVTTSDEIVLATAPAPDPVPPVGWGYYVGAGVGLWGRTAQTAHSGAHRVFLKAVAPDGGALNVALVVGESDGYTGAKAMPAVAGATYRYTFWAKGDIGDVGLLLMTWQTAAAEHKDRQEARLTAFSPAPEWKPFAGSFTMPPGANRFALLFQVYREGARWEELGALYVDDLEMSTGQVAVVRNGGAED